MTETAGLWAFQTLWESGVVTAVLVLCMIALSWMQKKLLTDKDTTISILRHNAEKRNAEIVKKDEYIHMLAKTLEKVVDTVEKNHQRNEGMFDKVLDSMAACKEQFTSLSNKLW